jgi:hypothetical protein
MESGGRHKTADPQLYQRWMFWIHPEVGALHIRDAGRDVIGLVQGEAIQPRCERGTKDGSSYKNKQEKGKKATPYFKGHCLPYLVGEPTQVMHKPLALGKGKEEPIASDPHHYRIA